MHELLKRQLEQYFGSDKPVPEDLGDFLAAVDKTYHQADVDREMSKTALELTEMLYRVNRHLTQATTIPEVAGAVITSVEESGADGCVVVRFEFSEEGEPESLYYEGVWRRGRETQFKTGTKLPIAEGPFPFEMVSTFWTTPDVSQDDRLPESARQVFQETGVAAVANIPLRTKGRMIGQVVVLRDVTGPFPGSAVQLYEMLSDQAAVALERGRLLDQITRRARDRAALQEIALEIASHLETDQLFSLIIRRGADLLHGEGSDLYLMEPDGETLRVVVSYNLDKDYTGTKLAVGDGLAGRIAQSGQPMRLGDYGSFSGRAEQFEASAFGPVIGVPLIVGGEMLGVLDIVRTPDQEPFSEEDENLLMLFSNQASIALENARLFEQTRTRARREQILREISASVRGSTDPEVIMRAAVRELGTALGRPAFVRLGGRAESAATGVNDNRPEGKGGESHA